MMIQSFKKKVNVVDYKLKAWVKYRIKPLPQNPNRERPLPKTIVGMPMILMTLNKYLEQINQKMQISFL